MEFKDRYEKFKLHVKENKKVYIAFGGGVAFAGITCLIVRGVAPRPISSSVTGAAGSNVIGAGKKVVLRNVSFFAANRQGPPSWVVRCLETGDVFTSQRAAALALGIAETNLSKHLNGLLQHAQGYHFERICLAA
jgi:hypothetical protein